MFPLLTVTTADRVGAAWTDRAIGLERAASAAESAALPALIGLLIGSLGSQVFAPALLGTNGAEHSRIRLGPAGRPSWSSIWSEA
jgi:hypothetical protein